MSRAQLKAALAAPVQHPHDCPVAAPHVRLHGVARHVHGAVERGDLHSQEVLCHGGTEFPKVPVGPEGRKAVI